MNTSKLMSLLDLLMHYSGGSSLFCIVRLQATGRDCKCDYLLSPSAVMPAWEKPRMAPKRLQLRYPWPPHRSLQVVAVSCTQHKCCHTACCMQCNPAIIHPACSMVLSCKYQAVLQGNKLEAAHARNSLRTSLAHCGCTTACRTCTGHQTAAVHPQCCSFFMTVRMGLQDNNLKGPCVDVVIHMIVQRSCSATCKGGRLTWQFQAHRGLMAQHSMMTSLNLSGSGTMPSNPLTSAHLKHR